MKSRRSNQSGPPEERARDSWENEGANIADELDLEERVLRLSRLNPDSFEVLYRKYYPGVFRKISLTVRDPDIAKSLTDETFSRVVDGLDSFQWRGVRFGAWIFKIAFYVVGEHFRKKRIRAEVPYDQAKHEGVSPSEPDTGAENADDSRILMKCVDRLVEVRREVIINFYGLDMKTREIAVVMDLPEATVKSHLQRGRNELRDCLVRNGVQRGLSSKAVKIVKAATVRDRQWDVLGGNHGQSQGESDQGREGDQNGDI